MKFTNFHIDRKEVIPANGHVNRTELTLLSSGAGDSLRPLQKYEMEVEGVMQKPGMLLRIEICELNHTTLKPILGQGRCEQFLDSDDACCEENRRFKVKIAAECRFGDDSLSNVRVSSLHMDNVTVKPRKHYDRSYANGYSNAWAHATVEVADMDVTDMAMEMIKEDIKYYVIEAKTIRFAGKDLTAAEFLNRVLRFNAPHQQFHCR